MNISQIYILPGVYNLLSSFLFCFAVLLAFGLEIQLDIFILGCHPYCAEDGVDGRWKWRLGR